MRLTRTRVVGSVRRNPKLARTIAMFVVFCLVGLVLALELAAKIGNVDLFASRTAYNALLPDATGLHSGDQVKIDGINVGTVNSIRIDHGAARVGFTVDKSQPLRSSSRVELRWRNVIGEKFLYVYPGTTGPVLHGGATLPESQADSSADIGAFLNAIGPLLKAINPQDANTFVSAILGALQGNQSQVSGLVQNAAVLSTSLGSVNQQVGSVIDNLTTVLTALAGRNQDINTIITQLGGAAQTLASNNDDLDNAITTFAQFGTQVRNLFADNKGNLDALINNLGQVTNTLQQHTGDLNAMLATSNASGSLLLDTRNGQYFQGTALFMCQAHEASCAVQPLLKVGPVPAGNEGSGNSSSSSSSNSSNLPVPPAQDFAGANPTFGQFLQWVATGTP